jgi:hypothetical protein
VTVDVLIKFLLFKILSSIRTLSALNQHQEDLINRQDNLLLIEEATEREPCGSRILKNFNHQLVNST